MNGSTTDEYKFSDSHVSVTHSMLGRRSHLRAGMCGCAVKVRSFRTLFNQHRLRHSS